MIRSFCVLTILTGGILIASAASLHADDGAMDKMYGNGVHAFFSGDYAMAHDCLSRAIDSKTKDPRCFYFRGLAYLAMGREPEAKADFAGGSDLEAVDVYKFYNVSKALERVQGKSRVEIEQYRAKARLKAAAEAQKIRKARYEQLRKSEARVLEAQAAAAPTQTPAAKPVAVKDPADPFSAGPLNEPATKAAKKPVAAKPVAKPAAPAADQDDPFAVAPAKPTKPATAPAKPKPAKPAAAKKSGGILGAIGKAVGKTAKGAASSLPGLGEKADKPAAKAPAAADDDPFGAAPAAKKPATKAPAAADDAPFDAAPAAADDDPFGAAPAANKPAAKMPAAADDDPFGAAPAAKKPAAKMPAAADDDPFGEATPAKPADKKPATKKPQAKPKEEIDPDDPFA